MSYGRYDDRRYSGSGSSSRRVSSPSSHHRDRRDRDRDSRPGPSRDRTPPRVRDDNELPSEFGRLTDPVREDENTVLRRMKTAFTHSPLSSIYQAINTEQKLKVWTRNFKEVRGICTGYVVAFDKHWNLVMSDVDEVFLKPRKTKTPYLMDAKSGDQLPDLPPKVPKKKKEKTAAEIEEEKAKIEEENAKKAAAAAEKGKTKEKKKKKKGRKINRRHLSQLFVRGDNIVMVAVLTMDELLAEEKEAGDGKATKKEA